MNSACPKCEAGPSDASGHDDLFTESFHGGDLMLKCRTCGSFWIRKATTDAGFTWTRSASSQGALTP
jgi:uncharacterized Zn finger protein